MALSELAIGVIEDEEEVKDEDGKEIEEEMSELASHHPSSELFDVSTTIDPSYIISLIRKLIPHDPKSKQHNGEGNNQNNSIEGGEFVKAEENTAVTSSFCVPTLPNNKLEGMDIPDEHNEGGQRNLDVSEDCEISAANEAWEEYGCILWDLAANKNHAEFMVENLLLDVLLTSLSVSQSVRVTEIGLGILANLACHEIPGKRIVSTKGLIEIVVDQLFLDDSTCLCEACRLFTSGLRGSGSVTWAEVLQREHIVGRTLWIAENTLNHQLLEKIIGLFLAMVDNQHEVTKLVLPPLMKLGLPSILVNLLACEVKTLYGDTIPDRYSVLDVLLEVIEALSVVDSYSKVISANNELFKLVLDVVKLPDKVEISSSCVTAMVLFANILSDAPDLVSQVSEDVSFFQGLLEILAYVSDDSEARNALWSILEKLLIRVQEDKITPLQLNQYVSVLVDKSEVIEEDLIDHKEQDLDEKHNNSISSDIHRKARITSLNRINMILQYWVDIKDNLSEMDVLKGNQADDEKLKRLIKCCSINAM